MMSMTLYHGEPNGPSFTVLSALFEKELDATLSYVDLSNGGRYGIADELSREALLSLEGEGAVLQVDGETLVDSVFIGLFLDELSDAGNLLPAGAYQRWQVSVWCRQTIERVAPAAALLGTKAYLTDALGAMPQKDFEHLLASVKLQDLRERWQAVREGEFPADKIEDSRGKIVAAVQRLEDALVENGEYIFGDFSLADLETYGWLAGMEALVPEAFIDKPHTESWLHRLMSRPSVKKALSMATVEHPENAWAPGPEINRWG